ncbi:MAG: GlsB/YeaQ/YmgE family stress response membrane protein [Dehalococcoidia bacterium]
MEPGELIALVLVGMVAGWIASRIVRGRGASVPNSIAVGVVGAFIGPILLTALDVEAPAGLLGSIVTAAIGAGALFFVAELVGSITLTLMGAIVLLVVLGGISISVNA